MTRSESINELAAALAKAQSEMAHAKKESENPHFRSRYADLASIWAACRPALTHHGLAVVQSPRLVSVGEAVWMVEVETTLLHNSGQSLSDVLAVPVSPASAQAVGSAITYARRYALAAFVGVAPAGDDDDGNEAAPLPTRQLRDPPRSAPKPAPKAPKAAEGSATVTTKVRGIVQRPMQDGRVKFLITGDDQHVYGTLKLEHAEAAKAAQEAGLPIEITAVLTDGARVIQALRELPPEPPL